MHTCEINVFGYQQLSLIDIFYTFVFDVVIAQVFVCRSGYLHVVDVGIGMIRNYFGRSLINTSIS